MLAHHALGWPLSAVQEVPRPAGVDPGAWRRFSRVARLAAAAAAPVMEAAPSACEAVGVSFDRDEVPLFFGTGLGEYSSSYGFLKSLFQKGPAMASPLLFQNSVHNAAAGHLSIAFGLRGPSETLCAGALTTLRTLERALCWLAANGGCALVVLADDVNADSAEGWRLGGVDAQVGEGGAAFLLAATTGGAAIQLCADPGGRTPEPGPRVADDFGAFCTVDAHVINAALRRPTEAAVQYPGWVLLVDGV